MADCSFLGLLERLPKFSMVWLLKYIIPLWKVSVVYACTYPDKNISYFFNMRVSLTYYVCFLNPRVSACVSSAAI